MDWSTVANTVAVAGISVGGTLAGVALTGKRDDRRAAAARRAAEKDNRAVLYREYLGAATVLEHLVLDSPPLAADWRKAVGEFDRCNANLILDATDPVRERVRALLIAWRNVQWHADEEVGDPPVKPGVHRAYQGAHADLIAVAREAVIIAMRADVGPDSDAQA